MTVIVDGAEVGKTPYEGVLAPGSHWVALRGEGKQGTQPAAANVQLNQTITLSLKAEELGGEARIETEPPGALVVLDGVPVGQGIWEGRLRLGTHKLDVSAEGYFGTAKTFEVGEKKATTRITLDRDDNSPFWPRATSDQSASRCSAAACSVCSARAATRTAAAARAATSTAR